MALSRGRRETEVSLKNITIPIDTWRTPTTTNKNIVTSDNITTDVHSIAIEGALDNRGTGSVPVSSSESVKKNPAN